MRTKAQYIERLGQMNRNLYSNGEKIDRLDPRQEVALHVMGLTFDAAWDPQSKELCTAASHLAGETINRFNHIHQNPVKLFFMNRRSCVISPPACHIPLRKRLGQSGNQSAARKVRPAKPGDFHRGADQVLAEFRRFRPLQLLRFHALRRLPRRRFPVYGADCHHLPV